MFAVWCIKEGGFVSFKELYSHPLEQALNSVKQSFEDRNLTLRDIDSDGFIQNSLLLSVSHDGLWEIKSWSYFCQL